MNYLKNDNLGFDTDLRNEILDEIRSDLSQMKPDIIASIVDEVMRKTESRYANLLGMAKRTEKRISELEKRISELERRANNVQKAPVQQVNSPSTAKRINTSTLYLAFHFDGWLYYPNKDMRNFLYRVREDGSENTPLTDHSVEYAKRVEGGYLYYIDSRYQERKLKLS